MKLANLSLSLVALVLLLANCSDNKFKVKGEIYGAENQTIVLEKADFYGNWVTLDSTKINKNGDFSFSFPSPASPDIYRLTLNGKMIYIPIDSTESINVTSSLEDFGRNFQLSGSPNAELLTQFEKELLDFDIASSEGMSEFKKNIFTNYMKDRPGQITSYYILTKTIGDKPLYDPSNIDDVKYFGAVATGYKNMRPNDPHTPLLEKTSIEAIKRKNESVGNVRTIEAEEVSLIDLDLINENGENVSLSSLTGKGKPVVVIFSLLNHEDSPTFNIELAKLYEKVKDRVTFYNVSLDEDTYAWRESAKNLPWITVYAPGGVTSQAATTYNVRFVPSFFIYDSNGELIKSPLTLEELENNL